MKAVKLHLGCGWRDFGPDWIHIDGGEYKHLVHRDITKLPYENHSVDVIYASHVLEYFDREEVLSVLKEWLRVLKVGGTLRTAVPNFEVMTKLYTEGVLTLEKVLGPLYGRMKMGDQWIYHKTTYDFKSLQQVLEEVGFDQVQLYDWRATDHAQFDDHSQAYYPHMDKENGILLSLNVECKNKS